MKTNFAVLLAATCVLSFTPSLFAETAQPKTSDTPIVQAQRQRLRKQDGSCGKLGCQFGKSGQNGQQTGQQKRIRKQDGSCGSCGQGAGRKNGNGQNLRKRDGSCMNSSK